MKKENTLLERALNDPIRKKYGFNIIFADKKKRPLQQNWTRWLKDKQTDEDLKKTFKPAHTNYGYLSGFNGLMVIDFDAHWIYQEALDFFGDRLNTFTVETPNGGFHSFFRVKEPVNDMAFKNNLKVEFLGGMNAIVYGTAKNMAGHTVEYKVYNKDEVRFDDSIVEDMKSFLNNLLEKYDFLNYKCISEKLKHKINHLTHEQRLHLSNLFLQKKASLTTTNNFFRMCSDYNQKTTAYQLELSKEKVDKGKIKYPTCSKLLKDFGFQEKDCKGCNRSLIKDIDKGKTKKDKKADFWQDMEKVTPEQLYSDFQSMNARLTHGMHRDDTLGLIYATKIEGKPGIYGVARNRFIKGLHESEVDDPLTYTKYPVFKGYTSPLGERATNAIVKLATVISPHQKKNVMSLSGLFKDILDNVVFKYLDFRNQTEYYLVALWIIGTYYRVLWTWYPYIIFSGLRDVGKSTALSVLAHSCFNGDGEVSGGSTESSIFRKASSTKGIIIIDHYEQIRKNKEKKQFIGQLTENAWKLNSTVDRVNTQTYEVETFRISCSIALGTRYSDEVLDEKGIKITMYDTSNPDIQKRSGVLDEDEYFKTIHDKCMLTCLNYQDKVMNAYKAIPLFEGLIGRDWNKFKPLLAMAKVIDEETNEEYDIFEKIKKYGIDYRRERKEDVSDLEEILLKVILEWNIHSCKYSLLASKMKDEGYQYYRWQTAQSDLKKLGIVKWIDKRKSPVVVYVDMERARERAKQRGVNWNILEDADPYEELDTGAYGVDEDKHADIEANMLSKSVKSFDTNPTINKDEKLRLEELSIIEKDIVKMVANPSHQNTDGVVMKSKVVDLMEALYDKDKDFVENVIISLKDKGVLLEPHYGFLGVKK